MNDKIKKLLSKINDLGFDAYIVGGYVRDYLLNRDSKDIDICTNAHEEDLLKILPDKFNEFGSLNIKIDDYNVDITIYRKEFDYQNHHPKIVYVSSLIEDLQRRDFTINAICMNKNGEIVDLLNGRKDLENKIIRGIGDNQKKMSEDPLRILRAIRLATILDFEIEESLDKTIANLSYLTSDLSGFRIKQEVGKILESKNYQKGLYLLKKYNLNTFLKLNFDNITYSSNILEMWAQIDAFDGLPFTKVEKENILRLREKYKK